jgi:ABC-type tungstate transport system permease subunit
MCKATNSCSTNTGSILVNPQKHPHVKAVTGHRFIDGLVSPEGQRAIADYYIKGSQLFSPTLTIPTPEPWLHSYSEVCSWPKCEVPTVSENV